MSTAAYIADSTDWLATPLAALAPLESSLRCQVCKDFFNTPVITSCSHTFCSLCIRRCLSHDGRCPACRAMDQELKLRRNWVVEELVANFTTSRDGLLLLARRAREATQADDEIDRRRTKRRKINVEKEDLVERRSTRSQNRRGATATQSTVEAPDMETVPDSEDEAGSEYGEVEDERGPPTMQTAPDDGLVACPCCSKRMKAEIVYSHLDTCNGTTEPESDIPSPPPTTSVAYSTTINTRDRLPTLAYSMLNDNALRKKLRDLGISSHGPKPLMQKRHTEWVNLWNANCDSRHPRTKRELLAELDSWERTQGRQILNNHGPVGVMARDFDGQGWARANKSGFEDLIRQAREKRGSSQKDQGQEEEKQNYETEEKTKMKQRDDEAPPELQLEPASQPENMDHIYQRDGLAEYPPDVKPALSEERLSSQTRDFTILGQ